MARTVAYFKNDSEREAIEDFLARRTTYTPDEWIDGQGRSMPLSVLAERPDGDIVICYSIHGRDDELMWGAQVGEHTDRGVTLVTVKENYVLKNDLGSKVLLMTIATAYAVAKSKMVECPHCGEKL